jgi:hypothetical protein
VQPQFEKGGAEITAHRVNTMAARVGVLWSPAVGRWSRGVSGCSSDWGRRENGEEGNGARRSAWRHNRFISEHGGGGWSTSRCHVAGEGRERGDSHPTDGRCPTGSDPRSVGVSGVARPCHAAGSRGEREGLTGGPGHIVLGGCAG